jgi:hypothetical protein
MKPKAKPVQTIVTPESGHVQVSLKCPISANSGHSRVHVINEH